MKVTEVQARQAGRLRKRLLDDGTLAVKTDHLVFAQDAEFVGRIGRDNRDRGRVRARSGCRKNSVLLSVYRRDRGPVLL